MISKNKLRLILILLGLVLLSALLLLFDSYNSARKLKEFEQYSEQMSVYNKLADDIFNLTVKGEDYILHPNPQNLDEFRELGATVTDHELELFNTSKGSNKQQLSNLMETTKTFLSFIEKEVVSVIQSRHSNNLEYIYLQQRNQEFIQKLRTDANLLSLATQKEVNEYFQTIIIKKSYKAAFLLVIMLLAMALLFRETLKLIKKLLIEYSYLDKLAKSSKSAVIMVDKFGNLKYFNKAAQELFSLGEEVLTGKNLSDIPVLYPHLQNVTEPLYEVIMHQKELLKNPVNYLFVGQKLQLMVDYMPVFWDNRLLGALLTANRVEAHKDKYILLDTLETERKRISIEIHDWIGRYMSTIIHSLDYILRQHDIVHGELRDNLLALRAHCQNSAIEMRGIMNDIHPYLIDKVGLISALESYIVTFEKLNNIKVYIFYQDRSLKIKKKDEIILYRIIQEALSNVVKHSKATEVDVHFTVSHDILRIEIEDNGGFSGEFAAGKGLWGMKERAKLIGGDISIDQSESGFCVIINVPLISGGQPNGKDKSDVN
ncbi:putative signal transduction histidine kinase [Desulfotomaculum nigrificans CO-1-SRB]|uniref:histidine kinase n=1 Tax=Desulfotomaculum nigrificans (strain DSM 14880 / VKM B-2319 / CO-1-SRB) TaxID=868595 RepID=F6B5F5_DESCC|nr:ATP-binding protein [Desulfotomaculum nigrificans]AEF94276.1 putative signal transduction histidine kinase [Desulfotomaculum nigrificans CO-1-SRB]